MTTTLVVEDGSVIHRDLPNMLARIGCSVLGIATSGEEALEKARELAPELVIVNVEVTDESLDELSSRLDLPVVYLSEFEEPHRDLKTAIELAVLRHRNKVVLDLLSEGVVLIDMSQRVNYANSAARELFDEKQLLQLVRQPLAPNVPRKLTNKSGDTIHVILASAQIPEGRGQVLIIRDISERVHLQEQLAVTDRLTSLGKMAAGIAHDINNPLAYVTTNIELTDAALRGLAAELAPMLTRLRQLGAPPQPDILGRLAGLVEAMEDARHGAERVRRIVEDLRTYSNPETRPHPIDPKKAIELAVRMCGVKAKGRTALVTAIEPTPPLAANEGRLAQILINLIGNAIESIPEGNPGANRVLVTARLMPDQRIELAVRDTGQGMDEQTRQHIFQPFFTTKPAGAGTGLGLSIVRRLVAEAGGVIEVESEVGKGSTFRLIFPPALTAAEEDKPGLRVVEPRRARILVVDDERLILAALRRQLGGRHEVFATEHPIEALEQIKKGARFDAILCEVVMRELSGRRLYETLQDIAPDQAKACIFVTGATMDRAARAFLDRVENRCVEKPFETETLERALREVLEARHRRSLPRRDPSH